MDVLRLLVGDFTFGKVSAEGVACAEFGFQKAGGKGILYPLLNGASQGTGAVHGIEAFRGNHGTSVDCLHYLICDGTSRMYYAMDSAWLLYPEYRKIRALAKEGTPVDYMVIDATVGWDGDYRIFEHNDLSMVLHMMKTLSPYLKKVCISHMARTLHTDHRSLVAMMKPYGIDVAYDGWTVEF